MNGSSLQIGEIALLSGVSVDTVRYYERLKLLPRAARSSGGYRIFSMEAVERIRFIKPTPSSRMIIPAKRIKAR